MNLFLNLFILKLIFWINVVVNKRYFEVPFIVQTKFLKK